MMAEDVRNQWTVMPLGSVNLETVGVGSRTRTMPDLRMRRLGSVPTRPSPQPTELMEFPSQRKRADIFRRISTQENAATYRLRRHVTQHVTFPTRWKSAAPPGTRRKKMYVVFS
ncbi:hypothetical protein NP493_582g03065 [Ridgeia piscesae]|uniref:Uncharacterized protein n=1 Tax=Ridgeia piscesae TaxID=27915 RepID=A0AAD9KVQ0_RIDPI|nr:hypothetical protein NP493_582g03065 [Ridgeia piscesae]